MRRWWLFGACLGLLLLTSHVFAIGEPIRDIEDVATIIPDDTAFYFVMRTDDDVLEDIDGLINRVQEKLAILGLPTFSLEDEIRRSLDEMGIEYDEMRDAIGDYLAFSVTIDAMSDLIAGTGDEIPSGFRMYVQVNDPDAMLEIVEVGTRRGQERDGYTLYDADSVTLAFSDDWVVAMNESRVPDIGDSLAKVDGYKDVFGQLPGNDYGALIFMTPEVLAIGAQGTPNDLAELGEQNIILAFAVEDEQHLIMDFVQTVPEDSAIVEALPSSPVDADFLRYVPEDADLVIQFTDFGDYLDYFDVYMESFSPGLNLRGELERGLRELNLDLQDDFISWMDGEALMYMSIDLESLAESNGQFTDVPIEFGLVLETSDARASQRIFDFITRELRSDRSSGVTVGSDTINDIDVTTIQMEIPNGLDTVDYELVMGVTDDVAFIASREAAEFITSGRGDSLLDNDDYNEAAELYLPGTKQLLYASDEGAVTIVGGIVALFYFSSGMEMPLPGLPNLQTDSPYVGYQPGSTSFVLDLMRSILHSASVTSTIGDGYQVSRFVFSLE